MKQNDIIKYQKDNYYKILSVIDKTQELYNIKCINLYHLNLAPRARVNKIEVLYLSSFDILNITTLIKNSPYDDYQITSDLMSKDENRRDYANLIIEGLLNSDHDF